MSKEDSKEPVEKSENKEDKKENQLEKLQAEKDEIFERLQRVSAEFVNYQKRSVRQISESVAYEKEHILKSLLPVLDNFEHTLAHIDKIEGAAEVTKGVKIIYDQCVAALKSHGVEPIIAVGEKFDPAFHQALTQRSEPDKEEMTVLEEFRTGYKLGDKILRPSIVIVNKKAAEPANDEAPADDSGSENGD
ncbi:MAG: nucleotide exchange factor GrpE [Planctomycetaceae bacterium]|nr:nucleotide exchange factor GrpE [Planctomycetaceae bacterium]